jgi:hypothetical protein
MTTEGKPQDPFKLPWYLTGKGFTSIALCLLLIPPLVVGIPVYSKCSAELQQKHNRAEGTEAGAHSAKSDVAPLADSSPLAKFLKALYEAQEVYDKSTGNDKHNQSWLCSEIKLTDVLLSLFTYWLVVVTAGLITSAQIQEIYLRRSWKSARAAAGAAVANVQTLISSERAYVFVEVVLDAFGDLGKGAPFGYVKGTVKFWNYGKTPAVITMIRAYMDSLPGTPQDLIQFEGAERPLPPSLGIATNCVYPVELEFQFDMARFQLIKNWNERIYILGKMEYRTVQSAEGCSTGFCWHIVYKDGRSSVTITRDSTLNHQT